MAYSSPEVKRAIMWVFSPVQVQRYWKLPESYGSGKKASSETGHQLKAGDSISNVNVNVSHSSTV